MKNRQYNITESVKNVVVMALALLASLNISLAENVDSISVWKDEKLSEVNVVAQKFNNRRMENISVSLLGSGFLKTNHVEGMRELTSLVPNLFMPDYGSRQNSPVFIRGIGSRTNAPSVAMYIDGVPLYENSSFDIDLSDVSSVTVLRGPQGSLYGRNAIGGIIAVTSRSPLQYQGTQASVGYGNKNDIRANVQHLATLTDHFGMGFSIGAHHNDGFFTNVTRKEKIDNINDLNGRLSMEIQPSPMWNVRLSDFLSWTKQGGYPYGQYDSATDRLTDPDYDRRSGYRRLINTAGVNASYNGPSIAFSSQSSFHYNDDHQFLDQDFTPSPTYFVESFASLTMFSQEIIVKSVYDSKYQWIVGLFGLHQALNRDIETSHLTKDFSTPKNYDIKTSAFAVYHQSTFQIIGRLSAVAGARFDCEKSTHIHTPYRKVLSTGIKTPTDGDFKSVLKFNQVTPRFSLQYVDIHQNTYYVAISRGYKTGGFNNTFSTDEERVFYPEYNWNYEAGAKVHTDDRRWNAEFSLFYIDWRDQQISQTIPGLGNIVSNAGHSISKGLEFTANARPTNHFALQVNYGYTHATFKNYEKDEKTDYSGNYIPLVPRHTLMCSANYKWSNVCKLVDDVILNANLQGIGPIYWRESNKEKQDYYSQLGVSIKASKGLFSWELWGKNITNTEYITYCFASSKTFAQQGKPCTFGTTVAFTLHR